MAEFFEPTIGNLAKGTSVTCPHCGIKRMLKTFQDRVQYNVGVLLPATCPTDEKCRQEMLAMLPSKGGK